MAAKLKKGDKVVVLAGKDKGTTGRDHLGRSPKANKAVVEGVNIAIRHTKQSQTSQGGRIAKAMPIDLSNLALAGRQRQGHPRRLPHGRRQEGAFRQDHRGGDLMLDAATYTPRLKALYKDSIRAALKEEFGYKNDMQIPRLDKIVLNMGVGEAVKDTKKVKTAAGRTDADRRPEGRHHQGQEVDRRLPRS